MIEDRSSWVRGPMSWWAKVMVLSIPILVAALLAVLMTFIAVNNNSHGEFCAESGWFFVHTMSDDCFLDLDMVVGRWFLWTFVVVTPADVTPSFPPAGIRAGRLFCA